LFCFEGEPVSKAFDDKYGSQVKKELAREFVLDIPAGLKAYPSIPVSSIC
jgi:hypothetical protein